MTKLTKHFTVDDLKAIAAFRAGQAGHATSGGTGSGGAVDFVRYEASPQDKHQPFTQELKLHGEHTRLAQKPHYSIKMRLETRALGEQLIPIRSVKHIWISPTEAVRYVGP